MFGSKKLAMFGTGSAAVLALWLAATPAAAQQQMRAFDIPAGELGPALNVFARQADQQIMFTSRLVAGKRTAGLVGSFEPRGALASLLRGTGLEVESANGAVITLRRAVPGPSAEPAAARPAEVSEISEVIVTASKRAESIQDVPISVTAITEREMDRAGYHGYRDWVDQVPGISALGAGKNRTYFVIRGVTTSTAGQNTQDPVAVYIGDVPVTDANFAFATPDLRLFDVNRIEVLRGPQGTTFGSGAMGGAVRVVVNNPDLSTFSARAEAELQHQNGGGFLQGYDAMVNIPLVKDKLALRLVGYYADEDGFVDNTRTGIERADHYTSKGVRALLQWQIDDDWAATASVIHQKSHTDDGNSVDPRLGRYVRRSPIPLPTDSDFTFYNLTIEGELGSTKVYSSSTYAEKYSSNLGDLTSIGLLLAPLGVSQIRNDITDESETFVQELRVSSNYTESKFDWIVGGYYRQFERASPFDAKVVGLGALGIPGATDDCLLCIVLTLPGKEYAAFGEVGYQMTDQFKLSVSGRMSWFDTTYEDTGGIDRVSNLFGYVFGLRSDAPPKPRSIFTRTKDTKFTPKVALNYTPNEDTLIYVSAAQGYRLGQNNPNFGADPIRGAAGVFIPSRYQADSLWSYELGSKLSFLDNSVTLNGAIYYTDWKDIQFAQQRPSDQLSFISNAGKAHTAGVEVELVARPSDALTLRLGGAFQSAKIDEGAPLAGSRKGDRLPGVPKVTLSAAADYTFPLAETGWDGFVRGNVSYVGRAVNGFPNAAGTTNFRTMGDYALAGVSAGVSNGQFDAALFINNLTDDNPNVLFQAAAVGAYKTTVRPRTIGLRLGARF